MTVPLWVWLVTIAGAGLFFGWEVWFSGRHTHHPSAREAATWLSLFVGAAVIFGIGIALFGGVGAGGEFFAGWVTEYSLSIDNLFIFIIIMSRFEVPLQLQQQALLVGIVLALVMRGAFIAIGAGLIGAFSWVFYLFGAFLVYTATTMVRGGDHDQADDGGRVMRWLRRRVPSTDEWNGAKLTRRVAGRRVFTPMALVIAALAVTDLLFALDSIPAIYGLTQQPYIVLTANIFALMGLRQLYFLLGDLLKRLVYLSYGLAVLLGFVGVKLILHALHENSLPFVNGGHEVGWAPDIPTWLSLVVIVVILVVTTTASLLRTRSSVPDGAREPAPDLVEEGS